ncbi:DUF2141 domain-containing protein [Flavobacterium sp. ASW18X]|uniref:DUF2141 domain-containing protein n=1 Tax=Flavobacterium sp. ASW18X TaxID=2572595 RepID=UPI0010AE42EE|nr:DUF2141 domain-containing protein [Flavobacterium sp. ASW18X]TKD67317.1 DUF2141 domain-containing protein [Flavobacterium sp. ASW18X]
MRCIFVLVFTLTIIFCGYAQENQLSVKVIGIPETKGNVSVAVYNTEDSFLKFEGVFKSDSILAKAGETTLHFKDLPIGEYALAVFYDANGNGKLDTNWLGIPKEKVGFSKARMRTFGPPTYKDCSFSHNGITKIEISL